MTSYPVILADPPVPFEVWSKPTKPGSGNRSAADHYSTMPWGDLNALGPLIRAVAAPDSVLLLWLCQPLLLETIRMAEAWGWSYKTKAFSWCKLTPQRGGFHVGMGYWTRANTEDVLLFTRGNPRRVRKDVYQLLATLEAAPDEVPAILAPLGRHSQKPDEVQDRIERLLDGPFLELFARRQRKGWTCIGDGVDGLDIRESLARLAAGDVLPLVARDATEQMEIAL